MAEDASIYNAETFADTEIRIRYDSATDKAPVIRVGNQDSDAGGAPGCKGKRFACQT